MAIISRDGIILCRSRTSDILSNLGTIANRELGLRSSHARFSSHGLVMFDLLIVGAGLTAATIVAQLRAQMRICVVDCRAHLGGNCFDYCASESYVHRYGPHIFHCPSPRIATFLAQFTEWIPYRHRVTAEIEDDGQLRYVPFPYSQQTASCLERSLNNDEVIEKFYRGYSQKMWGRPWEELPKCIRGRVPTNTDEKSVYHRAKFSALPRYGYTRMIENMLDGAELILGAPSDEWTRISAKAIVYTGRPDRVPIPNTSTTIGQQYACELGFRTLEIQFAAEPWRHDSVCLHACTAQRSWTRKTCFRQMTGGHSELISTETPHQAAVDDLTPYYPIETVENQSKYSQLTTTIAVYYPNLHLAGRLGCYRYFDMYQAVGQALSLAEKLLESTK